jgi:Secretion system C-terminal sorting domain
MKNPLLLSLFLKYKSPKLFKIMKKLFFLLTFCSLFVVSARAQYVTIPDANFRTYLQSIIPAAFNAAGQMDTTSAAVTTRLDIECTGLSIADLTGVEYFDNLHYLNCYNNQISFLAKLPPILETLECQRNLLTNLPALPSTLKDLTCINNQITSLPLLPSGLDVLYCQQNALTLLPTALPPSLRVFYCGGNQISILPPLPSTLLELSCGSNLLTSLPVLPVGLMGFACDFNQLTTLPMIPSNVTTIYCSNNQLTALPVLPNKLSTFIVKNNPNLTCIPNIPDSLALYNFNTANFNNTGITCFPNYNRYITAVSSPLPLCTASSACPPMTLNFTGSPLGWPCPPLEATLTNTSQNTASIRWEVYPQNPNGTIKYTRNGVSALTASGTTTPFLFVITESGCYTVKFFATSATGLQDSLIRPNYICVAGPTAEFTVSPTSGCAPLTVTYNITNAYRHIIIVYNADNTSGSPVYYVQHTSAATSSQTHTYMQAGTYYPSVLLSDDIGCDFPINGPMITVDSTAGFIRVSNNNICNGGTAKLSVVAPSGSTYEWQTNSSFSPNNANNQQITVQPTAATIYTVTITGPNGCIKIVSTTVDVQQIATPLVSISPSSLTIGCGSAVQLLASATQDGNPISNSTAFNWEGTGLSGYSGIINPLAQPTAQNSIYTVTVTGSQGCTATATAAITLTDGCVFPGDANYNGIANNIDVLSVGLGCNQTGAVRSDQSITWSGHQASDWTSNIPNGNNKKHADCNGDGTINVNDLAAIYQNYNRTHNNFTPTNRGIFTTNGVPIALRFVQDTFNITPLNDTIMADIFVGNGITPASNFYGFAASIAYDTAVFRPISITYDAASFLGQPNEVLVFGINDVAASAYDIAVTRRTQTAVSGSGRVARIKGVITENIAGKDLFRLLTPVVLGINDITAINAQNVVQQAAGIADTCQASTVTSTQSTTDLRQHIRIFPNPTPQNSVLNIVSDGLLLQKVDISNLLGQTVLTKNLSGETGNVTLESLSAGIYLIQIKTQNGVLVQKIIVE